MILHARVLAQGLAFDVRYASPVPIQEANLECPSLGFNPALLTRTKLNR